MRIIENTRLVKNMNGTYSLYNNLIDRHLVVTSRGARSIVRFQNRHPIFDKSFFDDLKKEGFITTSDNQSNAFICKNTHYPYLLKALNLELTDSCNLNCIHCYGAFGELHKAHFLSYDWLVKSVKELDDLQTINVTLTGGECSLHPHFIDICELFLSRGFQLFILTNGYNIGVFKDLFEQTKRYHYTLKISLDGFKETHDKIRNKSGSFERVCSLLELLKSYPNIHVYLSTTVMQGNIKEIDAFDKFICDKYPNVLHTHDLIFPSKLKDCGINETFMTDEFDYVRKIYPNVFETPNDKEHKKYRCTGGISQCTIMPDGRMKICNAACDEKFYFQYNVYENGLTDTWKNCGERIKYYRKEREKNTPNCKQCPYRKKCNVTDCRIIAYEYTDDITKSSPLTCYITKISETIK